MRKPQRGFIVPLLLLVFALLIVGGGAYVYHQTKQQENASTGTSTAIAQEVTSFTVNPSSGPAPLSVIFNLRVLNIKVPQGNDSGEFAYTVDFGDESAALGGMRVTHCADECFFTMPHTYSVPGTFTATLIRGVVGEKGLDQNIRTTMGL